MEAGFFCGVGAKILFVVALIARFVFGMEAIFCFVASIAGLGGIDSQFFFFESQVLVCWLESQIFCWRESQVFMALIAGLWHL